MAVTFSPAQEEWVASRPLAVQSRVRSYPPTQYYRLKDTGQKVWIHSYEEGLRGECDTCKVDIYWQDNPDWPAFHTIFPEAEVFQVFGVHFENLEPWPQEG